MLRIIPIVIFLAVCPVLIQSCGEESGYDIVVVNDAWAFGTSKIYLDDEFQFRLEVWQSDTIRNVKEGRHTILVKDMDDEPFATQTLDVFQDQQWSITQNFNWDWILDY